MLRRDAQLIRYVKARVHTGTKRDCLCTWIRSLAIGAKQLKNWVNTWVNWQRMIKAEDTIRRHFPESFLKL